MPSPPGVRHLGCAKAFLRNLFFGPSQGPQFPPPQLEADILDGEEFAIAKPCAIRRNRFFFTTIERRGRREMERPKVGPEGEMRGIERVKFRGFRIRTILLPGSAGVIRGANGSEFFGVHLQARLRVAFKKLPRISTLIFTSDSISVPIRAIRG